MRKLYSLDDLYAFCKSNKLYHFSAAESGFPLCVTAPAVFEASDNEADGLILFGRVKLLHTGLNRNKSSVPKEAAEKAMPGIKYKPILANFCDVDGVRDFTSHDIEVDGDGTINYIERQVGCFTADEPTLEYDAKRKRYYIYATAAIPREYTDAADIIERKGGSKISAELNINEMTYDAKKKELVLNDFDVLGATLLGVDPNTGEAVEEGMEGARMDIIDFNVDLNDMIQAFSEQSNQIIQQLNQLLDDNTNIGSHVDVFENTTEGGTQVTKLEELLEKYSVTLEELPFASDIDGKSDEELEAMFAAHFETVEQEDNSETAEEVVSTEEADDTSAEQFTEDPESEQAATPEVVDGVQFSVNCYGKTFAANVSMNEKIQALSILVNDTYCEADNAWYSVEAYDNYVVMIDWWANIAYRQDYTEADGQFALTGERVRVFANWLTEEEQDQLNNLKAAYDEVNTAYTQLIEAAEQEKRDAVISDPVYSEMFETDEWKELTNASATMSAADLALKADALFGRFCKMKGADEQAQTVRIGQFSAKTKNTPYGSLFD